MGWLLWSLADGMLVLEGRVLGHLAVSCLDPGREGTESFSLLTGHTSSLKLCVFLLVRHEQ